MGEDRVSQLLSILGPQARAIASADLRQLRFAKFHFGIAGEDAILLKLLKGRIAAGIETGRGGAFADIGALMPCEVSNTYMFYCLGWRGVAVDANGAVAAQWADARPKDVFVNAAVGAREGRAYWFRYPDNLGMSRVCAEPVAPTPQHDPTPVEVPTRRLDSIFAEHLKDRPLDLMCMDIEDSELDALASNDWNRWRPKVILVEVRAFTIDNPRCDERIEYLRRQGYRPSLVVPGSVFLVEA